MYLLHRSVGPSVQFLYSGCMIAAKFRIMTIEQRAVRETAENFVICDTQKSYSENLFRRLSEKLSGYFEFHAFHESAVYYTHLTLQTNRVEMTSGVRHHVM